MSNIEELRAWAEGNYALEAATELLIRGYRGRYAQSGNTWIKNRNGRTWIDFNDMASSMASSLGGEKRFLLLVASIGTDAPVVLGDLVSGLNRELLDLVLAAIAHAGGSHGQSTELGSLYPCRRSCTASSSAGRRLGHFPETSQSLVRVVARRDPIPHAYDVSMGS